MSTKITVPSILADFIAAQNSHDSMAFAKLFTNNAFVKDEGKEYVGSDQIRSWNEMTNKKYQTNMQVVDYYNKDGIITLTILMSGTFPGSPLQAKFHFEINGDKIKALTII